MQQENIFEFGGARVDDPETSHTAAASVDPTPLHAIIATTLATAPAGLTTHEIAARCRIGYWTITPRMVEMKRKGLVVDTGQKRKGESNRRSIVWALAKTA
jgi:hypothetical protein